MECQHKRKIPARRVELLVVGFGGQVVGRERKESLEGVAGLEGDDFDREALHHLLHALVLFVVQHDQRLRVGAEQERSHLRRRLLVVDRHARASRHAHQQAHCELWAVWKENRAAVMHRDPEPARGGAWLSTGNRFANRQDAT
eukprot:3932470-Rhodomonas_salina.2